MTETAADARATWETVEPLHALIYFSPDAIAAYEAAGVPDPGLAGYFASRAAAMGRVGPGVVTAAFFSFSPAIVGMALPSTWDAVTPEAMIAARLSAADRTLRRILGDDVIVSAGMAEAAALARRAADVCAWAPGRPLAAAHAALPWPDEPHLQLWQAESVLREYRGDGHVALLVAEGLGGVEAVVTHAAAGGTSKKFALLFRGWREDEWEAAVVRLRSRGWLDAEGALTDEGRARRDAIERGTDELAAAPYAALGAEGCERLRTLCAPWTEAVYDSGTLRRPR